MGSFLDLVFCDEDYASDVCLPTGTTGAELRAQVTCGKPLPPATKGPGRVP